MTGGVLFCQSNGFFTKVALKEKRGGLIKVKHTFCFRGASSVIVLALEGKRDSFH